jgi:D-alanine--poly(phosphoribitol) ligase subunit 1
MDFLTRIEASSKAAPGQVAYRHGAVVWTYADLRDASDALATRLLDELGPTRTPVAVYGHKEPAMLACFLACAKSGRPYVPIDATVPPARVRQVLDASGAGLLLTPGVLPAETDVESVRLLDARCLEAIFRERRGARPPAFARIRPEDDFYIMFTSGSTGTPKGVRVTCANVDTFLAWARGSFGVPEGSRFLNQVPFSFDVSVMDSYNALSTGGSVWALDRELVRNPIALFEELVRADPEVWVSTPSFVEVCLSHPKVRRAALPSLHTVLLCGEVLTNECAEKVLARFPGVALYNTYGPTEATVAVTAVRIDEDIVSRYRPLPLGRAKPDLYVGPLDDTGAPAGDGVRGEIVIEGSSVGPGYLNAPEVTARAFYEVRRGRRVRGYRTGDWGWQKDGLLFYGGRIDAQVKLHGHRIELEDVENNLRAIPEVRNAVVVPRMRDGRCDSLTAVLLCTEASDQPRLVASVRAALRARVPDYMVPQRFVVRDAFPMSVNGKINRKQLAEDLAAM